MGNGLKVGVIATELVCLFICTCIMSFVNSWLSFIRLGIGLVCLVVASVRMERKKESRKTYSIILFVIDVVVFVGWCILTICTIKSPPLLSYGLLGWWFAAAVALLVLCYIGEMNDGLKVGIFITELVCLFICLFIMSYVSKVFFFCFWLLVCCVLLSSCFWCCDTCH